MFATCHQSCHLDVDHQSCLQHRNTPPLSICASCCLRVHSLITVLLEYLDLLTLCYCGRNLDFNACFFKSLSVVYQHLLNISTSDSLPRLLSWFPANGASLSRARWRNPIQHPRIFLLATSVLCLSTSLPFYQKLL